MERELPGNEKFLCRLLNAWAACLLSQYDTIAVFFGFISTSTSPYSANKQTISVCVIVLGIPATKSLSSWYSPSYVAVSCCFFGAIGIDTCSFVPSASNTELVNALNASPSDQNVMKADPCVSVSETELVTVYGTREGGNSKEFNQYLGS